MDEIPKIDYSTIEKIIDFNARGISISSISDTYHISPETSLKIISDYYQNMDLDIEILATIDSYDFQFRELQIILSDLKKSKKKDDEINNVENILKINTNVSNILEKKNKALERFIKNKKTNPNPRFVPTEKQKEIIDILMKLGSADKKTIAEKMNPPVSETRVYHLLHGKNGKQGLINRFPGLSFKKQGNKNIYQLEYLIG